jgi:hypothetical protein
MYVDYATLTVFAGFEAVFAALSEQICGTLPHHSHGASRAVKYNG